MADTIDDVVLEPYTWTNLNTLLSITVGLPLVIQNKGKVNVLVATGVAEPDQDNNKGTLLTSHRYPYAELQVPAGENDVWVKCFSKVSKGVLSVQEA